MGCDMQPGRLVVFTYRMSFSEIRFKSMEEIAADDTPIPLIFTLDQEISSC
jgi:hypothetical protein